MQRNILSIPVSSAVGYVCIILVCPSFSSRYSVPHPLQFPLFFNLSNISMPFYTALCPWIQFLCFHSCCVWNTYLCIRFNFVLCRLTARSHIAQSPINPRFLNDRPQWYTLSPGSYVIGGSATGSVSRDGFFRKRNVKMGKMVPETCLKGGGGNCLYLWCFHNRNMKSDKKMTIQVEGTPSWTVGGSHESASPVSNRLQLAMHESWKWLDEMKPEVCQGKELSFSFRISS